MKCRILVADDEITIQELLKVNLEALGHEVISAYDGKEALECIEKEAPDLVILDINMPEADGWKICGELKSDKKRSGIPVIFLSAFTQKSDIEKGLSLGAEEFFTKPFNIKTLMRKVEELLKK